MWIEQRKWRNTGWRSREGNTAGGGQRVGRRRRVPAGVADRRRTADFGEKKWCRKEGGRQYSQLSVTSQWFTPQLSKELHHWDMTASHSGENSHPALLLVVFVVQRLCAIFSNNSIMLTLLNQTENFIRLAIRQSIYCGLCRPCFPHFPPFLLFLLSSPLHWNRPQIYPPLSDLTQCSGGD